MRLYYKIIFLTILFSLANQIFADSVLPVNYFTKNNEILQTWFNRIHFSGEIRPAAFASNHTPTTIGVLPSQIGSSPGATDLIIYFSNLAVEADISSWFKTLFNFAYAQQSPSFYPNPPGGGNVFFVDKALVIIANQTVTPFYLIIGRSFLPFGGLNDNSLIQSTTSLLSLSRNTQLNLSLTPVRGLSGSLYTFSGLRAYAHPNTSQLNNYGLSLSYEHGALPFRYLLGGGVISNIAGALYPVTTQANNSRLGTKNNYTHPVKGLDLHAGLFWKALDTSVKYINALSSFSVLDVPYTNNGGKTLVGAHPAAWDLNIGYTFLVLQHTSRFGIGYQGSKQAVALGTAAGSQTNTPAGIYGNYFAIGMPQIRYYANYTFNIVKGVDIAAELVKDQGYGVIHGGTGKGDYIGITQLSARFA